MRDGPAKTGSFFIIFLHSFIVVCVIMKTLANKKLVNLLDFSANYTGRITTMRRLLPKLGADAPVILEEIVAQTADAVHGANFSKVVIGLSGGMDSSIVAAIAVEAFGAKNVYGVLMPSQFSSLSSVSDAEDLALRLDIETKTVPIHKSYETILGELEAAFETWDFGPMHENLQARIRGLILMSISNQLGFFVLNTENKSESLAGYSTLHGDMVGGFAPIGSLYKTHVFELAAAFNELKKREIIPEQVFLKDPSAELSFDQRDTDSLPPYPELDSIFYALIDKRASLEDLFNIGINKDEINRVMTLVNNNKFKARYACPVPSLLLYEVSDEPTA